MTTALQTLHTQRAKQYDRRALTAHTRQASASYRQLAREHRLQALIAGRTKP